MYSATLIAFIIFGIISTLYEWVQFDLQKKEQDLYEDTRKKFSKMFFDCWNWQMENKHEAHQLKQIVRNEIKLNLDEDKIREEIKKRKRNVKINLFILRSFTLIINLAFLVGCWVLILLVNIR